MSPYFLLVGYVGELLQSRKQPGYLPALHKRSKHKVFRSLWHSTQIRGILGAGTSCTWSETKAVGQCLIRKSPPCGVSVHPGKMKLKVFFVFFFLHVCVFFSHSVSRGRLFHHPAGNLHGEGMHTQEYCCLLWELPLVGAILEYLVHVSLLCHQCLFSYSHPCAKELVSHLNWANWCCLRPSGASMCLVCVCRGC